MHRFARLFPIVACIAIGCATPGDPSCAVYDEITDQSCLKRVLYDPDLDSVGLQKTTWYNCPTAWTPACPGVECQSCRTPLSVLPAEQVAAEPALIPPGPSAMTE